MELRFAACEGLLRLSTLRNVIEEGLVVDRAANFGFDCAESQATAPIDNLETAWRSQTVSSSAVGQAKLIKLIDLLLLGTRTTDDERTAGGDGSSSNSGNNRMDDVVPGTEISGIVAQAIQAVNTTTTTTTTTAAANTVPPSVFDFNAVAAAAASVVSAAAAARMQTRAMNSRTDIEDANAADVRAAEAELLAGLQQDQIPTLTIPTTITTSASQKQTQTQAALSPESTRRNIRSAASVLLLCFLVHTSCTVHLDTAGLSSNDDTVASGSSIVFANLTPSILRSAILSSAPAPLALTAIARTFLALLREDEEPFTQDISCLGICHCYSIALDLAQIESSGLSVAGSGNSDVDRSLVGRVSECKEGRDTSGVDTLTGTEAKGGKEAEAKGGIEAEAGVEGIRVPYSRIPAAIVTAVTSTLTRERRAAHAVVGANLLVPLLTSY